MNRIDFGERKKLKKKARVDDKTYNIWEEDI